MAVAILLLAIAASDVQPFPTQKSECQWVRGQYEIANGSRVHRLAVFGSTHSLSFDVNDEIIPAPFEALKARGKFHPLGDAISGSFKVCALEAYIRGHLQRVHLLEARNLRIYHKRD